MDNKERAAVKAALQPLVPVLAGVHGECVVCAEEAAAVASRQLAKAGIPFRFVYIWPDRGPWRIELQEVGPDG